MPEQNPFIWQELVTSDQETSGTFFSKLFGWELKKLMLVNSEHTHYFKRMAKM